MAALVLMLGSASASAENPAPEAPIRLGFIGSLSSFASNYGQAVLDGANLAIEEARLGGSKIEFTVEDDQSLTKNTASAYAKLKGANGVQAIIGGSWWLNSIVRQAERDNIILFSAETLYTVDSVLGETSFILHGDLRRWANIYEPVIAEKGWKSLAMVKYTSGFGETLADELKTMFSRSGRKFLGSLEYNDIEISDASDLVVKIMRLRPDVVYIDGQPAGLANLLRRLAQNGLQSLNIITHSSAEDAIRGRLFDPSLFPNLLYTTRSSFDPKFEASFRKKYGRPPELDADLGYFGAQLAIQALKTADPLFALREGLTLNGHKFSFDSRNVFEGTPQRIVKGSPGPV